LAIYFSGRLMPALFPESPLAAIISGCLNSSGWTVHLSRSSRSKASGRTGVFPLGRRLIVLPLLVAILLLAPSLLLADEGSDGAPGEDVVATSLLATADRPVINEILYNPVNSAEALEYIELYNPTDRAISLSNWTLSDGIDYLFPATAVIPAKGYVIVAQKASCPTKEMAFVCATIRPVLLTASSMAVHFRGPR
jgi:hypothetical protein